MEVIRIIFRIKHSEKEAQSSDESIKVLNTYPEVEDVPPTVQPVGLNRNYDLYPEEKSRKKR